MRDYGAKAKKNKIASRVSFLLAFQMLGSPTLLNEDFGHREVRDVLSDYSASVDSDGGRQDGVIGINAMGRVPLSEKGSGLVDDDLIYRMGPEKR